MSHPIPHMIEGYAVCMCRSSLSAAVLQRDVVGRYASAPDLQALVAQSNRQPSGQGTAPDPTPARAPSPTTKGVARSLSYGKPNGKHQTFGAPQTASPVAYSTQPTLGNSDGSAVASPGRQYVLQMMQHNERKTALRRQLRRNLKFALGDLGLLFFLGVSMVTVCVCMAPRFGS